MRFNLLAMTVKNFNPPTRRSRIQGVSSAYILKLSEWIYSNIPLARATNSPDM